MSRKEKTDTAAAARPARARTLTVLAVAAVALVAGWMLWQPQAQAPSPAIPAGTAGKPAAPPGLAALVGNWVRPDGGYVLSVGGIEADGAANLAYFNPRPIRVGRAEARVEDGAVQLFVEFDDRDYPGSTYTLRHDPGSDQLVGIYYQAVQRASYEVAFVRQR